MNTMPNHDTLFEYLCGLKDRVQQAVMIPNSQDSKTTMTCADNENNDMYLYREIDGHRGSRLGRQLP